MPQTPPQPATWPQVQARRRLQQRRIAGEPGAALTWGIKGAGRGDVTAGIEGEKMVGRALNTYTTQHDGTYLFHSVAWPGAVEGDTDHILIRGHQMVIIDSKRWKQKRKYSVTAKGAILRGTVRFPEGKVKIVSALGSWRRITPPGTRLTGIVCIAQKNVFVPYDNNWRKAPFRLVTVENLPALLDRILNEPLTPPGVEHGWETAKVVLPRVIRPKPQRPPLNFGR